MTGYTEINIQKLSETMGEEYFQTLVSDFSCPLNEDVENFLNVNCNSKLNTFIIHNDSQLAYTLSKKLSKSSSGV